MSCSTTDMITGIIEMALPPSPVGNWAVLTCKSDRYLYCIHDFSSLKISSEIPVSGISLSLSLSLSHLKERLAAPQQLFVPSTAEHGKKIPRLISRLFDMREASCLSHHFSLFEFCHIWLHLHAFASVPSTIRRPGQSTARQCMLAIVASPTPTEHTMPRPPREFNHEPIASPAMHALSKQVGRSRSSTKFTSPAHHRGRCRQALTRLQML
jgi:hypothetical protein